MHLLTFTHTRIRELAAATASRTVNPTPIASGAVTPPPSEPLQANKGEAVTSAPADNSWSNMLGLWAWKKDNLVETATTTRSAEDSKGKP